MSRTITAVSNPFYSKADNSAVDCLVTFSDIGQHPYTSSASDDVPYGASLWASLQADTYGAIAPYVAPTPTPLQLVGAALAAGLVVTSTGTPAISGTYPVDAVTQAKVNGVMTCILTNDVFPNGAATLPWFDIAGASHVFPNVTAFKNFANAFINFVTPLDQYANSNGALGSIPSNAVTIA